MKVKIKKYSEKAITMIALVITIFIFIIITGIALSITIGENGTITRTSDTGKDFKYDNIYEELKTIILTAQTEDIRKEPTLKSVVSYLLNDSENEYIISSASRADDSENVGDIETENDVDGKNEVFIIFKDFEFKLDEDLKLHKLDFYIANADNNNNTTDDNNNIPFEPTGHVTNGLVLHLDGIKNTSSEHSNSTTTWYDLTTNAKNATKTSGTISWDDNALVLDDSTYFTVDAPVNDSFGTAEVCVKIDPAFTPTNSNYWYNCPCVLGCELSATQKDWGIIIDKNGYFAIGYSAETIYSSSIYALDGTFHTIAYSYLNNKLVFSIDGQIITTINYTPSGSAIPQLGIGWNKNLTSTTIKGKIYSIKYYDVELTAAELAQNHTANTNRFNTTPFDNLVLHLAGTNNTLSGHDSSTNTWYDLTEFPKNATKTAGTTSWSSNSLILDGSTYFSVPAPVSNSFGTAEVCVKIDESFNPINTNNWYECPTIFGCELSRCQKDWAIIIDKNGYFAIGYDWSTIYSSNIYAIDGNLHTVAYTVLSNKLVFSVDGQIITTINYSPYGDVITQIGIGWNTDSTSTTIKGEIYDIKFYTRELTSTELAQHHAANVNRFPQPAIDTSHYVLGNLKMHLDGINNTSSGHSTSTDTWYDSTSNGKNATKTAGTTSWTSNSLNLDGSTYFTVNAPVNDSFGTAEICVKIDPSFTPNNSYNWYQSSTILGCELGGSQKDWAILVDQNGYFAIGYDTSTIYSSTISALDNQIHTISYSYMQDKIIFTIDGNVIVNFPFTPSGSSITQLGIGWNKDNANTKIKGQIYDVRFYDKCLTYQEKYINHIVDQNRYSN